MAMREHYGVEMPDAGPQCLLAKVYGRVDQDLRIAMLDQDRDSQPFVTRVAGQASLAIAADGWNACRCACAEESELHSRKLPRRTQRLPRQFLRVSVCSVAILFLAEDVGTGEFLSGLGL
jgi:hypothetical protein